MHAIFIFGFMLPIAAVRISKTLIGVDWKTAFSTCSGDNSRLPRVRVNNNILELEDHIPSNISNTFWLGAVYEPILINPLKVSADDLRFPHVCCGVFPALSDKCINSCIPCHELHAYRCKTVLGEEPTKGAGSWITAARICSPDVMTRSDQEDISWNSDTRQIGLHPRTSGQEHTTCTYYCAGLVLIGNCSNSSGVDAICVTDKVDNSHPSSTSTISTKVSTHAGIFSLKHAAGTLSTQYVTHAENSTGHSTSTYSQMTGDSTHQRSTSPLTLITSAFTNSTTGSNHDTAYVTSTNMIHPSRTKVTTQQSSTWRRKSDVSSQQLSTSTVITSQPQSITYTSAWRQLSSSNTENPQSMAKEISSPYVKTISKQLTTSDITASKPQLNTYTSASTKFLSSNTENTLSISNDDPYVITLIAGVATVLIAFFVVLFLYCRLRRIRLKSLKSQDNMMDNVSFSASSRLNPIYGVDLAVSSDPHGPAGYLDPGYYTASDVSGLPTGVSNKEMRLPPGSEEWSELRGSRNIATYARPMKVPIARISSSGDEEQKRENENGGTESAIYASVRKDSKFRKYTNDAEGTLDTPDYKNMDTYPVESNVSNARLSGRINETSEGDYDRTDFSGWALDNGTSQNTYYTTNFPLSRRSVGIDTYL